MFIHTYIHAYLHSHINSYIHTYIHKYTYTYHGPESLGFELGVQLEPLLELPLILVGLVVRVLGSILLMHYLEAAAAHLRYHPAIHTYIKKR